MNRQSSAKLAFYAFSADEVQHISKSLERSVYQLADTYALKHCRSQTQLKLYYSCARIYNIRTLDVLGCKNILYSYLTIWERHHTFATNLNEMLQTSFLRASQIAATLVSESVSTCIFRTASPHHLDTTIFDLACLMASVERIYLKRSPFHEAYILPISKHHKSSSTLSWRLSCPLASLNYTELIKSYLSNYLEGSQPVTNTIFSTLSKNFLYALFRVFSRHFKNHAFPINRSAIYSYRPWSFLSDLKVLLRQKSYLTQLKREVIANKRFSKLFLSQYIPAVVLYAHYQPEATTDPDGGAYTSHIHVLIKLRSLGYSGPIFYKEHPHINLMWHPHIGHTKVGMCRDNAYLQALVQLDVTFVDSELLPHGYTNHNLIPVTINGSIIVERSLLGLSTIVCGDSWICSIPGAIHLDKIASECDIYSIARQPDPLLAEQARSFLEDIVASSHIYASINLSSRNTSSLLTDEFITFLKWLDGRLSCNRASKY